MGVMTALAAVSLGSSLIGAARSGRDKRRAERSAGNIRDNIFLTM